MVNIVKDRDLILDVFNYDVILVGTSILNQLGNGFQRKVGINFPAVYEAVKTSGGYGDNRRLGKTLTIEGQPAFVLCYITKGRFRPDTRPDALEYEALDKCLVHIATQFPEKKIATTIIGASPFEGGGDRDKVLALIEKHFDKQDIWVYDYNQRDWRDEQAEAWQKIINSIGSPDYEENKKKFFWESAFGIYKAMPDDISLNEAKNLAKEQKNLRKNF